MHRWPRADVETWPDYARADLQRALAQGTVREDTTGFAMALPFLCQVDLAEARAEGLPDHGVLHFFAAVTTDVADPLFAKRVASAVVYVDTPPERGIAQPPTPDPFPSSAVALRPERRVHFELPWEEVERIHGRLAEAARSRFDALCAPVDALLPGPPTEESAGPMPPTGEVALLRLVSHDELGLVIGDSSWLTFAIPAADLAGLRFEAARASVFVG
jgi:hypothetical protein